jgi:hypothetical protein
MRCEELGDALAGVVDGSRSFDQATDAHIDSCLRCQAELVQYRKLMRALQLLRAEVIDPGPGLLADIIDTIEEVGERSVIRAALQGRRAAYLGGLAATAAAGAATAAVLAHRSRRGRLGVAS